MRIPAAIALASLPAVPWKNGGGTTRTLAVAPEGASLEDFLWRVSLARVDAAGPFSSYPGVDRTILLWQGEGLLLRSPAWPDQSLSEPLQPFGFRGEDAVFCQPLGSSTEDLNLMVRRGKAVGRVTRHASEAVLGPEEGEAIVLCSSGLVRLASRDGSETRLEAGRYLHLTGLDSPVTLAPGAAPTQFVCIRARRLDGRRTG